MRNPSRSRQIATTRGRASNKKTVLGDYDPDPTDDGTDDPKDKPDEVVPKGGGGGKKPTKGGKPVKKPVNGAAVKHVMERRSSRGHEVTRKQAVKIVRKNVNADKNGGRAYKFDFAGDGAGVKDKDFGSAKNNKARTRMGTKKNWTVKANVKGASAFGTGKVLTTRKAAGKR